VHASANPASGNIRGREIARSGCRSRRRETITRDAIIEALHLIPDFLEDLVANELLDALPRSEIGVELLCQKALERSIPSVTGVLPAVVVAGFGSRFEQLRLRHQGTHLPALPLLFERGQSHPQPFDLLHQLPIVDEIQLMKIVEVLQEEGRFSLL